MLVVLETEPDEKLDRGRRLRRQNPAVRNGGIPECFKAGALKTDAF